MLGHLTPPGGVILVLPQSLAGAWLCSQLGHSGGRREPTPKPQAETGDRPREIGSWDCANDTREELPQPLGVGRGFRAVGCEVYLRAGLPQLPEVRVRQFGSPGRACAGIDRFSTLLWVGPGNCLGTHDLSATRAGSRRRRVLLLLQVTPSSPLSDLASFPGALRR